MSLMSIMVQGQSIPTTFLNCTVGKSTKAEVISQLSSKGHNPFSNDSKGLFYSFINTSHPKIDDTTPKFCDTWWHTASFSFTGNNRLIEIYLDNVYISAEAAKRYYDIVKKYLYDNYRQSFWQYGQPVTTTNMIEKESVYYKSGDYYIKLSYQHLLCN